jgi:hypothetical protein
MRARDSTAWIDEGHFEPARIATYAEQYRDEPARMIYIKQFLNPKYADKLSNFLLNEVHLEKFHSVKSGAGESAPETAVRGAEFSATPIERQFVSLGQFSGRDFRYKSQTAARDTALLYLLYNGCVCMFLVSRLLLRDYGRITYAAWNPFLSKYD